MERVILLLICVGNLSGGMCLLGVGIKGDMPVGEEDVGPLFSVMAFRPIVVCQWIAWTPTACRFVLHTMPSPSSKPAVRTVNQKDFL